MVILIGGVGSTGKTVMAQRLMEKYAIPYMSMDHVKMGLIKGWNDCGFSAADDEIIIEKLWPVIKGIVMTNIDNKQSIIIEGCYFMPFHVREFNAIYARHIIPLFIGFSGGYIERNLERGIIAHRDAIEDRGWEEERSVDEIIREHAEIEKLCGDYNANYFQIKDNYEADMARAYDWIDDEIAGISEGSRGVNPGIRKFVNGAIIPRYEGFDTAHNPCHAEKVIKNSMAIASEYDVDADMVYMVAAYHDLGLESGRKNHHMVSAAILRAEDRLREWFADDQIEIMAEACEDHRASNDYEPRSIYGKIVAEADRDIEYDMIILRTMRYGLKNYPEYDFDLHFERAYEHITDKYGENGYLKCWLNTDVNRNGLKALREGLRNKGKFMADCKKAFDFIVNGKA